MKCPRFVAAAHEFCDDDSSCSVCRPLFNKGSARTMQTTTSTRSPAPDINTNISTNPRHSGSSLAQLLYKDAQHHILGYLTLHEAVMLSLTCHSWTIAAASEPSRQLEYVQSRYEAATRRRLHLHERPHMCSVSNQRVGNYPVTNQMLCVPQSNGQCRWGLLAAFVQASSFGRHFTSMLITPSQHTEDVFPWLRSVKLDTSVSHAMIDYIVTRMSQLREIKFTHTLNDLQGTNNMSYLLSRLQHIPTLRTLSLCCTVAVFQQAVSMLPNHLDLLEVTLEHPWCLLLDDPIEPIDKTTNMEHLRDITAPYPVIQRVIVFNVSVSSRIKLFETKEQVDVLLSVFPRMTAELINTTSCLHRGHFLDVAPWLPTQLLGDIQKFVFTLPNNKFPLEQYITVFQNMKSLVSLELKGPFTNFFAPLMQQLPDILPDLKHLGLYSINQLTSLDHLTKLSKLSSCSIVNCPELPARSILRLSQLHFLYLEVYTQFPCPSDEDLISLRPHSLKMPRLQQVKIVNRVCRLHTFDNTSETAMMTDVVVE